MKAVIILIITLIRFASFAETRIAFIEILDGRGNTHQLEPGGRFAHVAISYKGRWLHAHPYYGVELVDIADLEKIGNVTTVSLPKQKELTAKEILNYLGKPYDPSYSWGGDGFYCSELVGKILGMRPTPMNFESPVWKSSKRPNRLGLSPDDIFRKLNQVRCEHIF